MTAAAISRELTELVELYHHDPFMSIEEARARLAIDQSSMARLLSDFDEDRHAQRALVDGPSGKYWTNTILPLERTGALDATLEQRPLMPFRVGLYPGPTCMFRCGFCVRVTGARYAAADVSPGNALMERIIDEVGDSDPHRVYFSGGLEPLTNPGLGGLVSRAAARGLRTSLYTNAFALTPQTVQTQSGLWDLATLRVSLYGTSEEEYLSTTGRRGFARVRSNLHEFLSRRQARGQGPRVGLNYIVLPGAIDRLPYLAELVGQLNEVAPEQPIDFLTLREDYSGQDAGRLSDSERSRLRDALLQFDAKVAAVAPSLVVDRGYALEAVALGHSAELLRVPHTAMRPGAHPQVAVQVDLLGDVYLYREAGFPGLPGATRYIAGRVDEQHGLLNVITRFVDRDVTITPAPGDEYFLDGFDQVVTARLRQMRSDIEDGWGHHRGLLKAFEIQ